jgi:uncharacterized protein
MRPSPLARCLLACGLAVVMGAALECRAADALSPLDLRRVKVGGEIGRRIDVTVANNLLKIDVEHDFLAPFRKRSARDGYIGLGKLIDATARFAAYTGDPKVVALENRLVAETIATQQPDGYIGIMAPEARMSGLWDIHERGYIVFGLLADYRFFGREASLAAARKLADSIVRAWPAMPSDWSRQTHVATHVAVTGLARTMLALHEATREPRYLDFCLRELALPDWNPGIVIGRRDGIVGHVYAYNAACLAQLELDRLRPDKALLGPAHKALDFITAHDGLAVTGGVGQCEIWTDDQDGRGDLGETCATAYQIRVYDSLLRLERDPRCGDLMERTIYNALFAAQSPDGRKLRYYSPFEGPREYFPGDTYCCPCNFRRIIAELPTMVYYRADGGLFVNLYTASEAKFDLNEGLSVTVRQETDYPSSGRVTIHVDPAKPATFPLGLRIPRWCTKGTVRVNGQPVGAPVAPGTILPIIQTWKAGDRVELDLPMEWRLVAGRKQQAGRAAVVRGPLVFCLDPEQNPALAKKDGADLSKLVIDRAGLEPPVRSDTVRPGGVACRLKACDQPFAMGNCGNLTLTLTEFADPKGKAVYFRLPDMKEAVADELTRSDDPPKTPTLTGR